MGIRIRCTLQRPLSSHPGSSWCSTSTASGRESGWLGLDVVRKLSLGGRVSRISGSTCDEVDLPSRDRLTQYIYITYLGLNALPFLIRTELLLFPLLPLFAAYAVSLLGFNVARWALQLYFGS
ncbi:hypothetical protein FRC12_024440 [Ceratobasidium sp. 428]|nr:hypothetical protein FRC12_024440 [Ceratobasidium sp. 428]